MFNALIKLTGFLALENVFITKFWLVWKKKKLSSYLLPWNNQESAIGSQALIKKKGSAIIGPNRTNCK